MNAQWPADWSERVSGKSCEMCEHDQQDEDEYGIRIYSSELVNAVLQRAKIQRGYTLVIWRGRHVVEPYELSDSEAARYWLDVLKVAKALATHYQPLKMNYETLGNTVPHLHTHLVPRFTSDPAPGRPFPLLPQSGSEERIDSDTLTRDAMKLKAILARVTKAQ
jgi:diadenosine tetraphosphate (Ap4A) HIT family hydrolase